MQASCTLLLCFKLNQCVFFDQSCVHYSVAVASTLLCWSYRSWRTVKWIGAERNPFHPVIQKFITVAVYVSFFSTFSFSSSLPLDLRDAKRVWAMISFRLSNAQSDQAKHIPAVPEGLKQIHQYSPCWTCARASGPASTFMACHQLLTLQVPAGGTLFTPLPPLKKQQPFLCSNRVDKPVP